MNTRENYDAIYKTIDAMPVFSDHEHHQTDAFFAEPMTLDRLFQNSYVAWTGYTPKGTYESRAEFLENARFNSYFTWLERGLQHVHGFREPVTVENWDRISQTVGRAYAQDRDFHWKALKNSGYERLVQDSYWNPGDDCGHPEVLVAAFRIDKFMYGYHPDAVDPDGFKVWERYSFSGGSLADYMEMMKDTIGKRRRSGKAVALKCGEAYLRPIDFLPNDRQAAESVFGSHPATVTRQQQLAFGNYIFNRCCELAAELDIPFQVHTGLADLSGSNPMKLEPIIRKHPRTRFVLFHSGFPWVNETAGLAHNYGNVLPSLTWTATISTTEAVRALHMYIEAAMSVKRITWGSDCWVAEESAGAMLAWKYIVARVLSERLSDRLLHARDVEPLAARLMHLNGREIYMGCPGGCA